MDWANWRARKIPYTLAMPGIMTPTYELMTPILFSIRNRGSIVTCAGITIEERRSLKIELRPLNLNFANASPAMELTTREISVTATARNALLKRYLARFRRVKRLR